jgi:hypothetical protein
VLVRVGFKPPLRLNGVSARFGLQMVTVTALKALRLAPVLLGLYIAAQPRATLPSVWALVPSVLGPHLLYAALYAVILLASARYLLFRRRGQSTSCLERLLCQCLCDFPFQLQTQKKTSLMTTSG